MYTYICVYWFVLSIDGQRKQKIISDPVLISINSVEKVVSYKVKSQLHSRRLLHFHEISPDDHPEKSQSSSFETTHGVGKCRHLVASIISVCAFHRYPASFHSNYLDIFLSLYECLIGF